MCWVCDIENLKAQIANKDINVYKVVMKATKKSCISPFMNYTYLKDMQPPITLKVIIEPRSTYAKITEGYYSYPFVNFVCDSVMLSIDGMLYKSIKCGNRKEMFAVDNSLYLATFIIPAGSIYFINEDGVIISNRIRYTGKYLKL